jgi:predicted phosphodiesterase
MGSSERRPRLVSTIRTQSIGFLFSLCLILSGCQEVTPIPPSHTEFAQTATLIPTTIALELARSTPRATATQTASPTITSTPGPSWVQTEIHSEISYISPITVHYVTEESVVCSFEFDHPTRGYLFYWRTDGGIHERQWIALDEVRQQHVIKITGLDSGEEYQLAVGLLDGSGLYRSPGFLNGAWDPIRVRTSRQEMWPIRVGVLGDSGFGDAITYELAEEMATYDLDFVLHTGDIVYNVYQNNSVQEAFAFKYFKPLAPVLRNFPLYPVPGNHEYYDDAVFEDKPYYFRVFPSLSHLNISGFVEPEIRKWYAIEHEFIQILMLDSQRFWRGEGRAAQTAWLKDRLSDDRFQVTIPVFHVPPFTSGLHQNDGRFIQTDWVPLFEDGDVPLVLSGHDHNYERLYLNGVTYIVTGGGSAVRYPMGIPLTQSQFFAKQTHFVLLEIYPEYLNLWAITKDGEILDQAVIEY